MLNIFNKKEQLFFVLNIFDLIIKTLIGLYLAFCLAANEYAIYLFYLNISGFINIFLHFGSDLMFRKSISNHNFNINKIFTFVTTNLLIFISAVVILFIFKKFEILLLIAVVFYQVNYYFYYEYFKLNYLAYIFFLIEKIIYAFFLFLLFEQQKINISNVALSIFFSHLVFIILTLYYFRDKIIFKIFQIKIFFKFGLKDVVFHGSKFFLFGINNLLIYIFHIPSDYAGIIIILKLSSILVTLIFFPIITIFRIKLFTLFDQKNFHDLKKEIKKMILSICLLTLLFVSAIYIFVNNYSLFNLFGFIDFLSNKYNFKSISFLLLFLFVIIIFMDNLILQFIYMINKIDKFIILYALSGLVNVVMLLLFNKTIAQMLLITFIISFLTYVFAIYKIFPNKKKS
jgi:hypothetical protein